ncbi:hypothetical protein HYW83_02480 [Candidatus Peregrinibacteria bacterium]|nr:hypothetical protein [Candidatus Peregrinibacteria bacterium]
MDNKDCEPLPRAIEDMDAFLEALERGGAERDKAEQEGRLEEFLAETRAAMLRQREERK